MTKYLPQRNTNLISRNIANLKEKYKADEEADGVVQEVTKVLLDLGVLRKHIDDILEKSHINVSSAVLHAFILVH